MKILQLCKKFPYPLRDGESIAITNLSRSLVDSGCKVDLLAMNTARHHVELSEVGDELNHYNEIFAVEVDNRIKPLAALKNLIQGQSYHISRFESDAFKQSLTELLENGDYDVVQLETLYLTPYIGTIRNLSKAVISMRAHNVEHEIWDRIATNTTNLPKKWYLRKLTEQLKKYEVDHLNDFDFLIAISSCDLDKFKAMGYHNGAVSTPIGLDTQKYNLRKLETDFHHSLSFIGSLDWLPNLEGLDWFLDNVVPNLEGVKLHVAGRNTPERLTQLNMPNVVVHGEVADALHFINQFNVMVVPLLSGSGMRVKILEGMALGKLVITTSKGVEGIKATHGENIIIADTAEDFTRWIEKSMREPEWARTIAENAKEFIVEHYDANEIGKKLLRAYKKVISEPYSSHV